MAGYERLSAEWPGDIEPFPELDDPDLIEREINAWFTPYIFYERKSRGKYMELWTSCCGRHEGIELPPRTITPELSALADARHNYKIRCPYCGREALVKCLGRSGSRRTLTEYHPVVILQEQDGDLFARAYWVVKNYEDADALHAPPLFNLVGAYHFTAGGARYYAHVYYHNKYEYAELTGKYDPKHEKIKEPFTTGGSYGYAQYEPYAVIGMEELDKSRFKYCEYTGFGYRQMDNWGGEQVEVHSGLMKYLALCSIYPQQVEMLIKTGWATIVSDMLYCRSKNAAAFNWESEVGGAAAFGLTKPEYRAVINSGQRSLKAIAEYKRLKKAGLCRDIDVVIDMERMYTDLADVRRACTTLNVKMEKLHSYIQKQGKQLTLRPFVNPPARALEWTLNYWDMVVQLGWDMTDSTVLFPKDIKAKHDTAAEELTAKRRLEEDSVEAKKRALAEERLSRWRKKYNIEQDGYFIRIAESAKEIVHEGTVLKHCVAGYAQRHMDGQCTILFLRRCETPEDSLYTIEMRDDKLWQIHGYANEHVGGKSLPAPRNTMAWLLDPWLDWIRRGSPRSKDGKPKLKMKKEKTA